MARDHRRDLLAILRAGLAAVHGRGCVRQWLQTNHLRGPVWVVAIGKAAPAMAAGAQDMLGSRLQQGLLITKRGYLANTGVNRALFSCHETGHPLPDQESLLAGQRLLQFLREAPSAAHFLFLISGGTSSLVEIPPEGIGLDDLRRANRWLLAGGYSIQVVNQVRKRLSCIKGGRLARHLLGRPSVVLMISDVIGDDPGYIGSGLLAPDPALVGLPGDFPEWLQGWMHKAPMAPPNNAAGFDSVTTAVIARLGDAQHAAVDFAQGLGYRIQPAADYLQGDSIQVGRRLAKMLLQGSAGIRVWGGETTMNLPKNPGRGGRNQSLALAAAMELSDRHGVWLLSVGTDGTDGVTEDAGALVDGGTISRGRGRSFDPVQSLAAADAGTFLAASGDLIRTGPTGTNVMDLVIGLKN